MQTYIFLVRFTDQGVRNIKDTIGRADAFKTMAEKSGATIKTLCWTIGRYDALRCSRRLTTRARRRFPSACPRSAVSGTRPCAPSRSRRWARSSPRWSKATSACP